ncbi:MAG: PA14 domain-containing protein, partial [Limisphaerales bacterium]
MAGRNYLYTGSDSSMTNFALYNWSPASGPVNLVFIEPQTFNGSGFSANKMGHAFVTESGPTYASGPQIKGKRITEFVLSTNGNLVSGPTTLIEYTGAGKATVAALAAGPDGLYFSDLYKDLNAASPMERGANILRIRFVGLPPSGNGDGLTAQYFDNSDLTNLKLARTNATVDFNWGTNSPDPLIAPDTFSARWTGQVQPQFSETYSFSTVTDDGVRLWVDNQLLIDKWIVQGGVEWTGNLALTAYRKYDIKMEYYENIGAASAQLLWSSPTTAKSIIPQTQLYSGALPVLPFRFASSEWLTNNQFRATLTGAPGEIHRLEVSSNPVNWTLLTILTNINGTLLPTDTSTNN